MIIKCCWCLTVPLNYPLHKAFAILIHAFTKNLINSWIKTAYDHVKRKEQRAFVTNRNSMKLFWNSNILDSQIFSLFPVHGFVPPSSSRFPDFYSAQADVVIYCGHPSLPLIHHRPVARQSWQQLFAFEFDGGAVSQRRQVKSITNTTLSRRIINQGRER